MAEQPASEAIARITDDEVRFEIVKQINSTRLVLVIGMMGIFTLTFGSFIRRVYCSFRDWTMPALASKVILPWPF